MLSQRRRGDRGVLRAEPEDRLLVKAIRHHQALRDRELWRQEISLTEEKPKASRQPQLCRVKENGFAAEITRREFGRFYFKEMPAELGKSSKRKK